jgi:hypothetical protein
MVRWRLGVFVTLVLLSFSPIGESARAHAPRTDAPRLSNQPQGEPGASVPGRFDIMTEDFEGIWPPNDWVVIHEGGANTWARTDADAHGGSYSAWVNYGPLDVLQDEYLVTPAIDLSTLSAAYLAFYESQSYWQGYGEHHYIGISTTSQTDPGAFTMLVDWTPANHMIPTNFEDDAVVFNLSVYAGEPVIYLCFRYYGTYADDWYIDDVKVFEPYPHDVAVHTLDPNGLHLDPPASITPQVAIENLGANAETFDLEVIVTESGATIYDEILSVSLSVAAADTIDFPPL